MWDEGMEVGNYFLGTITDQYNLHAWVTVGMVAALVLGVADTFNGSGLDMVRKKSKRHK